MIEIQSFSDDLTNVVFDKISIRFVLINDFPEILCPYGLQIRYLFLICIGIKNLNSLENFVRIKAQIVAVICDSHTIHNLTQEHTRSVVRASHGDKN